MTQIKKQDIENVLEGMLSSIVQDNKGRLKEVEHLPQVQAAIEAAKSHQPNRFNLAVMHTNESLLHGLLDSAFGSNSSSVLKFLYMQQEFVGSHVRNLITRFEGPSCSEDKVSTVLHSLSRSLATNERIELNYDQPYTYHLPSTILTTHEQMTGFLDALFHMYYGRLDKYVMFFKEVVEPIVSNQNATMTQEKGVVH